MSARLTRDEEAGIVAAILAGKFVAIIALETGRSHECIRYIAAKHRLHIASRYSRVRRGSYWQAYFSRRRGQGGRELTVDIALITSS